MTGGKGANTTVFMIIPVYTMILLGNCDGVGLPAHLRGLVIDGGEGGEVGQQRVQQAWLHG